MAGGAAAGVISSGTKTILALWAENPELIWGFGYNFTNYDFRKTLESLFLQKDSNLARGVKIKVVCLNFNMFESKHSSCRLFVFPPDKKKEYT